MVACWDWTMVGDSVESTAVLSAKAMVVSRVDNWAVERVASKGCQWAAMTVVCLVDVRAMK